MKQHRVAVGVCFLTCLVIGLVVLWKIPHVRRRPWKPEVRDANQALKQWYVDPSLIASATTALGENPAFLSNTLNIQRDNLTDAQTIWCGNRTFELRHAVSLLSVFFTLKPDVFHFYYDLFPRSDKYNQWIQYIFVNYPFFKFARCHQCCSNGKPKDGSAKKNEGMYVSTDIVISIYNSYFSGNSIDLVNNQVPFPKGCHHVQSIDEEIDKTVACFNLEKTKTFIAADTWSCTSGLCESIRYYMYQKAAPVENTKHDSPVIPNIGHYVNYDQDGLDINWYLSILSLVYIGNLSHVYIHSNRKIGGEHWNNLMKQPLVKERLHLVYRNNARWVYGQEIRILPHTADSGKLDVLYKYGGIVVDPDLMLIRKLDPELFHYDTVLSYDIAETPPFPDRLNLGISMARPQSVMARIWRESMRRYFDNDWLWNSGEIPYKVMEYNPYLAKPSKALQVMVFKNQYLAPWLRQQGFKHNIKTLEEWQKLAYSFHFTFPDPFHNLDSVWSKKGMTGNVGRYILKRAGIKRN